MAMLEKRVSATKWVTPSGRAATLEALEEACAQALSLMVVAHDEGHLRVGRTWQALEAAHAHDRRVTSVATRATRSRPSTWVKCSTSAADSSGCTAKNRLRIDSADRPGVERDEASAVVGGHRADVHVGQGTVHARTASGSRGVPP